MQRVLAISPHLDDAVLSAGGRLCELASEGVEVTVLTLFAGIPTPPYSLFAELLHEEWQLPDNPVEDRRTEDVEALKCLGAQALHGPFLDIIYRARPDGQWMVDAAAPPPTYETTQEPQLSASLAAAVTEQIARLEPDRILTCAAVGDHIDHRRTRNAVLAAAADQVPVWCWEDLPYSHQLSVEPPALADFGRPVAEPVGDRAWEAKHQGIDCYRSQHSMLWPNGEDIRSSYDTHARHLAQGHGLTGRAELFGPVRLGGVRG
ncbi:PIG-L deacetylase family protein [Streptantibioticus silvisoli]|uniref:PIG-L family deacetylase n=1 Tax=Streptantibioticus silvisoli TaxID=2705255 RepID=A0ABT6VVG6_9ACTN|nr:PIG-L family deacetylase [Streptantibioticus silvisoli]MDI5962468.1 PIG-L family deacetylase [Streptantibioticus silvisoli]